MEYVSLKEVVHIKHGYAFKGEFFTEENTGKIVLTPGNFSLSGGFIPTKKYTKEEGFPEEFILKANDLIVTMTDLSKEIDTIGFAALIPSDDKLYLHNQRIGLVTIISNDFDKDYIYWLMRTKCYQRTIANTSNGATVHHTSPDRIYKYKFKKISLPIQQKIASILTSYDRLIENNIRRIRLLEQMAENLYKEWFVRFRFPEHEKVEMVNGLPKGWNKKGLGNIADVCMGSSPKSEYYNDEKRGLPFHQGVGSFGERFILDNTYSTSYSQIAEPMSILFSVRAPVGRLNYTRNRIVIGRGVAAINHKEGMQSLLFYTLKAKFFKEDIIGNGAIFSSITKKELLKLKLIVANKELRVVFNNKINKIDREIDILYKQIQLLTRQRDLLLPRLMSGKLEVKF